MQDLLNVALHLKLIECKGINGNFSPFRRVKKQLFVASCHNRLFGHCGLAEEVTMVSIIIRVKRCEKRCFQTGKKHGLTLKEKNFPERALKVVVNKGF